MSRDIKYNEEARTIIKRGADKLANAVRVTLGPKGRNVILSRGASAPMITNDGVTIAKDIVLHDEMENLGAEIIKEVAEKANEVAGDGTTTAVVLAQSIITEGFKNVAAGANPLALKRGIDKGVVRVLEYLKLTAKKISTKEEMAQVATVSAESAELGALISEAMEEVGKHGVITVEPSNGLKLEKEVVKGLQFGRGYVSHYMATNIEKMEAVYQDVPILVTDKKISSLQDILPILKLLSDNHHKQVVIIADDISGEALTTLIVNKLKGVFNTLAIKVPGFGDNKMEILEDVAAMIGAEVITETKGMDLSKVTLEHLGSCRKIVSTKESTTIIEGTGLKADVDKRIALVKKEIEDSESAFDKGRLQERLAKMTGGVAIIKVGAATEVEQIALQHKTEDALSATKAAVEEGVVAGGGTALLMASVDLASMKGIKGDELTGLNILKRALMAPVRQIAENAGLDGAVIANEVIKGKLGYNAETLVYEDLVKVGIVDPAKVVRSSLQNAASAAGMFLTTECIVAEEVREERDKQLMV